MRYIHHEVKAEHSQRFRFHHITDLHVDAPDFAEEQFLQRRELIKEDPDAFVTLGGDLGSLIRFSDRRFQEYGSALKLRYQQATDIRLAALEHCQELLEPVKDKIIGAVDGNHEDAMDRHYGGKFGLELLANMGVSDRWLGARGLIKMSFLLSTIKVPMVIDLHHGWQAGRTKNIALAAIKEAAYTEAHVILRGHSHDPGVHQWVRIAPPTKGMRVRRKMCTCVDGGAWTLGHLDEYPVLSDDDLSQVPGSTYSERKGYPSRPIAAPVIIVKVERGHQEFTAGGKERGGRGPQRGKSALLEYYVVKGENVDAETLGL